MKLALMFHKNHAGFIIARLSALQREMRVVAAPASPSPAVRNRVENPLSVLSHLIS
jgi:hypothetical protein